MNAATQRTVLVADADEDVRNLVALTLQGERTRVVTANDLGDALAALRDDTVDLALIDEDLAGSGLDACRQLKGARDELRTVLLVSKLAVHELAGHADDCDGILTKPFTALALLRKVDELTTA